MPFAVAAVDPGLHRLCGLDRHRAVGAATLGIIFFGEAATAIRLACIALIVAGVVGLKLSAA